LAQQEVLILPHLYGPNGAKNAVLPDGTKDPSVPQALLNALEQLETASVDPATLAGGQTIDSVEDQTLRDLSALYQTTTQDIAILRSSTLSNIAIQALAFDGWASKTSAVQQDAGHFTPASDHPPATILQPPPPPADGAEQFLVTDTTTGVSQWVTGTKYSGTVAGIDNQFVAIGADNLNIQATKPNNFIHAGPGIDSISVAMVGAGTGVNVLDGGGGSNFLVGTQYSATDLFYVDARGMTASTASTVVNFHQGDQATVWGVDQTDFQMVMADNEGAPGYTGLTIGFTNADGITANLTISGYSQADLASGRLSMSFGRTPDTPGLPGSTYMTITANAGTYPAVTP
ncbi:MAG TPA: hypothetical protein VE690_16285, partial [Rhodopila sp.]|nr:hypothetical protein [Rhodopila sp.]